MRFAMGCITVALAGHREQQKVHSFIWKWWGLSRYYAIDSNNHICYKPCVESPWLSQRILSPIHTRDHQSADLILGIPAWLYEGQGSHSHSWWRVTVRHSGRSSIKSEEGWVFWVGGGRPIHRQDASPHRRAISAPVSGREGKTNYQRNDWRVRRASHSQPPPDGHN